MTDKKKQPESPAPVLGDIAAELSRARAKAGLSHSDLHRITGISRSVIFGYENGRTKPGSREIRLLCDALKVSPNRLIYGSDDPQYKDEFSLFYDLDSDTDRVGAMKLGVLMLMLSKEERLALLTLMSSILEARHGKGILEKAFLPVKTVSDVINSLDESNESMPLEELEEYRRIIEDKISQRKTKPKITNK